MLGKSPLLTAPLRSQLYLEVAKECHQLSHSVVSSFCWRDIPDSLVVMMIRWLYQGLQQLPVLVASISTVSESTKSGKAETLGSSCSWWISSHFFLCSFECLYPPGALSAGILLQIHCLPPVDSKTLQVKHHLIPVRAAAGGMQI